MKQPESYVGPNVVDSTAETVNSPYEVLGVGPDAAQCEIVEAFENALANCPASAALNGADPHATIVAAGDALGVPYDHGYVGVRVVEVSRQIFFPR